MAYRAHSHMVDMGGKTIRKGHTEHFGGENSFLSWKLVVNLKPSVELKPVMAFHVAVSRFVIFRHEEFDTS